MRSTKRHPFHTTRALGELLRVGNQEAIDYIVGLLRENGGNMGLTAKALGVGERTLYKWRDAHPKTAAQLAEHVMGRAGAAACALEARVEGARKPTRKRRKTTPRATA